MACRARPPLPIYFLAERMCTETPSKTPFLEIPMCLQAMHAPTGHDNPAFRFGHAKAYSI